MDHPADDRTLVTQMLAGREDAFAEFFDVYFPRLYRFALARVGNEDGAEEIAQATMIQAMRKVGSWRGEAALFTWLCTLCRHEISSYCQRFNRPEVVVLDDAPEIRARLEALAADADTPHGALERRELQRFVQLTLDYLPSRYGDVLEWKYINGLSVREIAERLNASAKSVESLLTRARLAFRDGFTALTGVEP
jgi:RNA polymerase sigma-70 factor, ECF subfamily